MSLCELLDNHLWMVLVFVLALVLCTGSINDIKRVSNDPTVLLGAAVAGLYVSYTTNVNNGLLAAGIIVAANALLNYGVLSNSSAEEHFNPDGLWNAYDPEQVKQFQDSNAPVECSNNQAVKEMTTDEKVVCNVMGNRSSDELDVTGQEIKDYLAKKTERVDVVSSNDVPLDYKLMDVCPYMDYSLDD